MVGDDALAHPVPPDIRPVRGVILAIARAMSLPHMRSRHAHVGGLGIRHCRQDFLIARRQRHKEALIDIIARAISLVGVPRPALVAGLPILDLVD